MKYDPTIHHRRSIRLKGYDYAQAGACFVTICAQNRKCLFGDVACGEMRLNDAGRMVEHWYRELASKFPEIECDAFICMPNHVHFITVNTGTAQANVGADLRVRPIPNVHANAQPDVGADLRVRPAPDIHAASGQTTASEPTSGRTHRSAPTGTVVQWFKTMSTNEYIRGVKQNGWPPFPGRLWQRNYWEHVIRNDDDLNRIREYIQTNPLQWEQDKLHPEHVGADLCVRPDVRPDDRTGNEHGQTRRSAPTEIRESSTMYAAYPNDKEWMV